jgi:putative flippase GtrA/glycosyltransferase involved in cell wall biosynthesis
MTDTLLTFETPASGPGSTSPADVEIVIPVYNEEAGLERSIRRVHGYLTERFPLSWRITIADNASVDATWEIACRLARDVPGVRAVRLPHKGRGGALRAIWSASPSPVLAYMDVDLSTDLDALLPLVAPLVSGHSDLAIGTRLARGSRVERGPKREVISRVYNLIIKAALGNRFSDAQCGFKAVRADVARVLLPLVEDDGWFFDTELLALAEHNGLRIHEVEVDWIDDPDSRVDLASTARDDLKGLWHLRRRLARGGGRLSEAAGVTVGPRPPSRLRKLIRYATVSAISSAVSLTVLGVLVATGAVSPGWANVIAIAVGTVPSFELNRRWVWGKGGRRSLWAEIGPFCALSFAGLGLSTATVSLAAAWAGRAGLGAAGRTLAAEAANVAAFGSLWIAQYMILDRVLFRAAVVSEA